MTYFRTSLLTAIGLIGIGLGTAGGCAEGGSVNSVGSAGGRMGASGGSAGSRAIDDGGSTGIPIDLAGAPAAGMATTGGSTSAVCDLGLKRCGPECVDVTSNPLHCGDCGKPCAASERECVDGACTCPAETHAVCDEICVDLRSDLANCGTCGRICPADRICSDGACVCDPTQGTTLCGTKCVDLMTDPMHCGACNETETPTCDAAQVCTGGECASKCKATEEKCGNKCADLKTDSAHCGACDKPCDATRTCVASACECVSTRKLCGTVCADTQSDSKNCGDCGKICTPGTECSKGKCVCMADATQCPVSGSGGAGSATECVDIAAHPSHCGKCNNACSAAESCQAGQCTCVEPSVNCGTPPVCTDLQTSNAHCGDCGKACDTKTQSCQGGECICNEGLKDCGSGCVDTTTNVAHCGDCDQPCTGNQLCSSSVCISGDIRVYTKMQKVPASATEKTNSIGISIRICNTGTSTVSLKSARVVYWYSMDGAAGQQVATSPYSSLAGVTVAAVEVDPMLSGNDYSLVATLPDTASLPPPSPSTNNTSCFDEIQMEVHAGANWPTGYVPANDWSYLGQASFAVNEKVAMYLGGAKMWGNEPPLK